jgi:hypothetical protein
MPPVEEMENPAQQQHVQFSSVQAQLAKMGVRTRAPVSALYKPKALKEFTARNPNGQHSGIGRILGRGGTPMAAETVGLAGSRRESFRSSGDNLLTQAL